MLPDDDGIFVEIGDVGTPDAFGVLLHDHPADVGIEETFADGVRVLVGVCVTVVSAVVASPPSDGSLDRTAAESSENDP